MDFTMTFWYVYLSYCTCLREAFILPSTVLSLLIFLHSSKSLLLFFTETDERKNYREIGRCIAKQREI